MLKDNEVSDLVKALSIEDDVGKVIRTHISIEVILNNFIEFVIYRPKYLSQIKLDYSDKVYLAISIGLSECFKKPLLLIGKMRNSFAHKQEQVLNENWINNYYSSFASEHKKELNESDKNLEVSWVNNGIEWKRTSLDNQFMVMSMFLFWSLKMEVLKFKHSVELGKQKEQLFHLYMRK